jgi:hypothetical protein
MGDWQAERKTAEKAAESRGMASRDMAVKTLDKRVGAFVYAKIGGGWAGWDYGGVPWMRRWAGLWRGAGRGEVVGCRSD